ncbi:MAG: hypothetical protein HYY23_10385 [Verrucomicrobia bacterium]|nr:hypothetical protein [Verrucomicrobiota bacterium]
MTVKRTKPVSLEELWDYEDRHPVVFASPRALAEARLIAELERAKRSHRRRANRNGASRARRKPKALAIA